MCNNHIEIPEILRDVFNLRLPMVHMGMKEIHLVICTQEIEKLGIWQCRPLLEVEVGLYSGNQIDMRRHIIHPFGEKQRRKEEWKPFAAETTSAFNLSMGWSGNGKGNTKARCIAFDKAILMNFAGLFGIYALYPGKSRNFERGLILGIPMWTCES